MASVVNLNKTFHRYGDSTDLTFTNNTGYGTGTLQVVSGGGTLDASQFDSSYVRHLHACLNRTQPNSFRANLTTGNVDITVQVYGTMPVMPHYPVEGEEDLKAIIAPVADGSDRYRYKMRDDVYNTGGIETLSLQFNRKTKAQFDLMVDFWRWHKLHLPFYWDATGDGTTFVKVKFDSKMKYQKHHANAISFSVTIKTYLES